MDTARQHWTLRVVSDASQTEDIDVKKDTERIDEIRAIKRAWEEAEPGRAARAAASRQKFLEENMIRVKEEELGTMFILQTWLVSCLMLGPHSSCSPINPKLEMWPGMRWTRLLSWWEYSQPDT